MPYSIPNTQQFPWDEPLSRHLAQLNDPSKGGINTWITRPTVGVDGETLGANHVGYTGLNLTSSTIDRWDGTQWNSILDGTLIPREAQISFYVNQQSGDDSNNGLTAGTSWKTTSKMYQELAKYNFLERQINLYIGPGSYNLDFPQSTTACRIVIQGQSSSSVSIQNLLIYRGQTVLLSGVTLEYPSLPNVSWVVAHVDRSSTLLISNDVVLGPIGTFTVGHGRWHFYASANSSVNFYADAPVTVTGDVNALTLVDASTVAFWNYQAVGASITYPNRAPLVDRGLVYTTPGSTLSAADTIAFINFTGTRVIEQVFDLRNNSSLNGNSTWKASVTGNLTGKAYRLASSTIFGSTALNTPGAQGVAYPSSISAGTKDTDSSITQGAGI